MMKKRYTFFLNIIALLLPFAALESRAQTFVVDSLIARGDSLRSVYRFEESIAAYSEAVDSMKDTLGTSLDSVLTMKLSDRLLLSENGKNMTGFVYSPTVVAKHMFSLEDFFLYYPFFF